MTDVFNGPAKNSLKDDLSWVDQGGYLLTLTDDPVFVSPNGGAIGAISVKPPRRSEAVAVGLIDEQDAREVIRWLTERLGRT